MASQGNPAPRALDDPFSATGILQRALVDIDLIVGQARGLLRAALAEHPAPTADAALGCLQLATILVSGLSDTWSARLAERGGEADCTALFDRAAALVADLDLPPTGMETADDPAYAARARQCAANLLARHWLTGMMLGIHDIDAWPNAELVRLLQPAIEQHADTITLDWELDRLRPGTDEP